MVEATAGALGTMVTCVLLYPVDIAKLHMQAGKSKAGALATMRKIVAEDSFSALYKGLPPKAVHVIINNYLYFYIYEWLKAKRSAAGLKASTLVNTALGVIAGVANLTVTLPLDTLVVRVQADGPDGKGVTAHAQDLFSEGSAGMWRGMGVSSILTLNPALTFAVFDAIKARLTKALGAPKHLSAAQAFVIGSVAKTIATILTYPLIRAKTFMQAASSKALKDQGANGGGSNGGSNGNGNGAAHGNSNGTCSNGGSSNVGSSNGGSSNGGSSKGGSHGAISHKPQLGFAEVLLKIWKEEGIEGLYRGCGAQIFTAVCKSGILLTTKEKIAAFALGLLLLMRKRHSKAIK